jgi:hypothetical protein
VHSANGLSNASARKRAISLASLAIVSAILSNFAWSNHTFWVPALVIWNTPVLPGIFFGVVPSLGIWLWVSRQPFKMAFILLASVVAWIAVKIAAERAYASIQQMLTEIASRERSFPRKNFMLAASGVLGGLAGSSILTFALSLICKEFGMFENWARIVMPGMAFGVLLELSEMDDKLVLHIGSLLPLFLAWQMTVAAAIGYSMIPRSDHGNPAPD